jgi:hypothetical protein
MSVENREFFVPDGLTGTSWPVYPEVGSELGLAGNYIWKINDQTIVGVESYIPAIFYFYAQSGIQRGGLKITYTEFEAAEEILESLI